MSSIDDAIAAATINWNIGDKAEVEISGFTNLGYPILKGSAVATSRACLHRLGGPTKIETAERQALEAWVTYKTFLDTLGSFSEKCTKALDVANELTRIVMDMRKPPTLEQMLDTLRQTVVKARMPVAAVSEILDQITAIEKAHVNENQV